MMDLNYPIMVLSFILAIISFFAGAMTYKHVIATRNKYLIVLVLSWFSWTVAYILIIITKIIESNFPDPYWKYALVAEYFFQILGVFSLIIFVDMNYRESIDPFKICAISTIGSLYITLPLIIKDLSHNITIGFIHENELTGFLSLIQLTFGLFYFSLYFLWVARIWKNSPKSLRRITRNLFFVFLIASIVAIIGYILSIYFELFVLALYLFHGIAILSIVFTIQRSPKILNILPFVAQRMQVLNRESGVLLYEYLWTDKKNEQENLSSFLHGIQRVSENKLAIGELKSLDLREGLLILDNTENFTYALLTSKSTPYLRSCFENFKENFEKQVKEKKISSQGVVDTADFRFGDILVEKFFKYIPSRVND